MTTTRPGEAKARRRERCGRRRSRYSAPGRVSRGGDFRGEAAVLMHGMTRRRAASSASGGMPSICPTVATPRLLSHKNRTILTKPRFSLRSCSTVESKPIQIEGGRQSPRWIVQGRQLGDVTADGFEVCRDRPITFLSDLIITLKSAVSWPTSSVWSARQRWRDRLRRLCGLPPRDCARA